MTRIFAQSPLLKRRSGADVVSLAAMLSTVDSSIGSSGGYSSASVYVSSNGSWSQNSNDGSESASGNWITPTTNATSYSVRYTVVSGNSPTGASVNTWLTLTTLRTWVMERFALGTTSGTGTVEIALTANTGVILASKTMFLSANIFNDGGGGPDP